MIPLNVVQEIYWRCDIDTKIVMTKAFIGFIEFISNKLSKNNIHLVALQTSFADDTYIASWKDVLIKKHICSCGYFNIYTFRLIYNRNTIRWFGYMSCVCRRQ